MTPEVAARFWPKVDKAGPIAVGMRSRCWLWNGALTRGGYGHLWTANGYVYAHRLAWEDAMGEALGARLATHRCNVRRCIRPSHVRPGTHLTNREDAARAGTLVNGARSHFAKLTDAQARAILDAPGVQRQIAKKFGISPATVCLIKRRRKWKHLTRRPTVQRPS